MKHPAVATAAIGTIPVLSASPNQEDHQLLEGIFSNRSHWAGYAHFRWTLYRSMTIASAVTELRERQIAIVVCEQNLVPGTWKDLLTPITRLATPPLLIVTSRLADEYLWAEAINLGAHDVLAKPIDIQEFTRIVSLASL